MEGFLNDVVLCLCACANWLDIAMVLTLCALLLAGYPAAFSLAGTALLYGLLGLSMGAFDVSFFAEPYPIRIFGIMNNQVLIAVPLFIIMGVVLEKSRIAEDLLDNMARLFGSLHGGLGISVTIVGALLAASTGIVGATVVTMGLLSLPTMLRRGYDPAFSSGSIAAAGTLGQIIPPSIVLILLGDQMSNAWQKAQLAQGVYAPETVSVGDLFAGALLPGLMLVGLYLLYQTAVAWITPNKAPALPKEERGEYGEALMAALKTLPPPLILIVAVLGSILAGIATPTEAAGVGAVGAMLIAGHRLAPKGHIARLLILVSAAATLALVVLGTFLDLRVGRNSIPVTEQLGIIAAALCCMLIAIGVFASLIVMRRDKLINSVVEKSASVTTMVFTILIGAALFSLVFRGLGGEETIARALEATPGGAAGAIIAVMIVMFILGFVLDFIEITLVVVPLVAPALLMMGVDPVWLGVLMAVNLQTSFLTPPFGFALFYLRGVAPESVRTTQIYRGALPFVLIQILALGILALFPEIATWLPSVMYTD
ncbi:TRAP transporter large permease [Aquisalinus luteolus]|uniref:C4-dicarboxylate ABC transporter n=2 Tax=Aquisalinus luteolus TaxID=1566827 RepID=A0A8J3A2Q5_9PROT|nr:TRAP transporter large permease subunit [Aquisalinus luteolus]GGH95838.1 C4-dicarboxylate ABC transporter [Aquisalinus luteolus]